MCNEYKYILHIFAISWEGLLLLVAGVAVRGAAAVVTRAGVGILRFVVSGVIAGAGIGVLLVVVAGVAALYHPE